MTNLWGDLPDPKLVRTPLTILRDAAAEIGERTSNRVLGDIRVSSFTDPMDRVSRVHELWIVAPKLDHYDVKIVEVRIREDSGMSYPVFVSLPGAKEIECRDEGAYVSVLQQALGSERSRNAVATLLREIQVLGLDH